MDLGEMQILRQKIQALIRSNEELQREKQSVVERLRLREKQVLELRQKCERYERTHKEAYQRITAIIDRIESIT
jgi:FtsZ-binding cell division protein ZapB